MFGSDSSAARPGIDGPFYPQGHADRRYRVDYAPPANLPFMSMTLRASCILSILSGLLIGVALESAAEEVPGERSLAAFDRELERQGITFHVTCANNGSVNALRIVATGFEIDNSVIDRTIDGVVTGAEVADIDADGSPEIYVFARSAGSGSYGLLVAYSANRRRSLSEIHLRPLMTDTAISKGFMGHDRFAVAENGLLRRFPVYRAADINAEPTGGFRELHYRLISGEAGGVLEVDRVIEFP